MSILITGALIASPAEPPFDGWVRIRGDRIESVGQGTPPAPATGERHIDARGGALLAGLVNTHAHSHSSLTRGSAEGLALEAWLAILMREQSTLTDEEAEIGALATYAEALLGGTTAILDMCLRPGPAARAAETIGIRALIAPYVADGFSFAPTLANTAPLLERYGAGRVRACVGLHDLESSSDTQIREGVALARRHDAIVHLHCAESSVSTGRTVARTGRSPVRHLEHLGVFERPTVLAHCVWLDDADRRALAAAGASVAHCPHANLKLGSGIADVCAMRQAGIHVALATDGAKANNRLDLFDVMKFASLVPKGVARNPSVLPPADVLAMASAAGARALGIDAGVIAAGKLADLTLVRTDRLHLQPALPGTIATNLVHAARGADVELVVVDGRVVVEGGRLTLIDESALIGRLGEVGRGIMQRTGAR